MTYTFSLGARIREARGTVTQDDLATRVRDINPKLKMTGQRISRYERNMAEPRLDVVAAIATATGQPLEFFASDRSEPSDEPSGSEDDEEAALMFRAAYELECGGDYMLADALRQRARKAAMRGAKTRAAA